MDIKKIKEAISGIEKSYGKGSIMKMDSKIIPIKVIPTGSLGLDIALGVGGFPRGRVIEIAGWESAGKSTLTIHAITEAQKQKLPTALIDVECAFDPKYAEAIGVKLKGDLGLFISQPDNGEQALDIVERLAKSGEFGLIVVDSVAALTPKAELEGEMIDASMGLHARLMSKAMRKLTNIIKKTDCCLIFINQFREKIGVVWGNPTTTTGGNALKFYASIRLEVSRCGYQKDKENKNTANKTRVKVIKNKVAPPFGECEFDIIYGQGISKLGEIVEYGVAFEIIDKNGSWFSYKGTKLGQGRDKVIELLKDNPELTEELENSIKKELMEEELPEEE